jgi:hypothetical protein
MRATAIIMSTAVLVFPAVVHAEVEPGAQAAVCEGPREEWLYIDADVGVESLSLTTFRANSDRLSVGFLPSSGLGPTASVGLGARLVFLSLGVRGRVGAFSNSSVEQSVGAWQVWTLDAELGIHVPLGALQPRIVFAFGYTTFGGFGDAITGLRQGLNVNGVDAGLGLGFDYYVTPVLSLGLTVNGLALALSRPGVSIRNLATAENVTTIDQAKARLLQGDGSSWGGALTVSGAVGLHF